MEAKYTPECITLLEQSKETAKTFGGGGIKPEHIFYTLLTMKNQYINSILESFGVNIPDVISNMESHLHTSNVLEVGNSGEEGVLTSESMRYISAAEDEAYVLGDEFTDLIHVLLAEGFHEIAAGITVHRGFNQAQPFDPIQVIGTFDLSH